MGMHEFLEHLRMHKLVLHDRDYLIWLKSKKNHAANVLFNIFLIL